MAHGGRATVFFITNSESGQANNILTLVAELLSRPDKEVHVASFVALENRVAALRDGMLSQPSSSSLTFYTIQGTDMNTALRQRGIRDEDLIHPPTTNPTRRMTLRVPSLQPGRVKVWYIFDTVSILTLLTSSSRLLTDRGKLQRGYPGDRPRFGCNRLSVQPRKRCGRRSRCPLHPEQPIIGS